MNHSFPLDHKIIIISFIKRKNKEILEKKSMGSRNADEEDDQLVNIDHAGKIIEKVLENVNFDCGNLVCNSTSQRINTCQSSLEGDFKFLFFTEWSMSTVATNHVI